MTQLPILDLLLLLALGMGMWRGMATGALRQIVGVAGLVVGVWLAGLLMEPTGSALVVSLGISARVAPIAGFVVVLVGVLAVLLAASHLVRATLATLRLGFIDRGLGALLGGLHAAFLLSLLLFLGGHVGMLGHDGRLLGADQRELSVLYEPLRGVAPGVWNGLRTVGPRGQDSLLDKFQAVTGSHF